jgi:hypothetical protein
MCTKTYRIEKPPQARKLLLLFTQYRRKNNALFKSLDICFIYYSLMDVLTYIIHRKQHVTAIWTHCVHYRTCYNTKPWPTLSSHVHASRALSTNAICPLTWRHTTIVISMRLITLSTAITMSNAQSRKGIDRKGCNSWRGGDYVDLRRI